MNIQTYIQSRKDIPFGVLVIEVSEIFEISLAKAGKLIEEQR